MSNSQSVPVWRLKSQADRRFRAGHPWVYSNELQVSPKGLAPGALVELQDAGGKFLARGYGNPVSLIAFRALSRDPELARPDTVDSLLVTLRHAGHARRALGMDEASHRLCFGEADGLPGLVIDRFVLARAGTAKADGQVFVVQLHTAGAGRFEELLPDLLERYVDQPADWARTAIVLRNDLSVRKLEGLEEQKPRVLRELTGVDLSRARILVQSAVAGLPPVPFAVDLVGGQKTGFFLDQSANIELAAARLAALRPLRDGAPLRVLDLFCYVGQWSTKLAQA